MTSAPGTTFALPVARVLAGFWLRRHRTAVLVTGVAGFLGLIYLIAGQPERARVVFGEMLLLAPVAAGLLTTSGIVSDERDSGLMVMWFQKRGSLFRTYFFRYAVGQALLVLFCTFFALCAAATGVAAGLVPFARGARIVSVLWVFAVLPASIVFAVSAWGVKRDAAIALILILLSLMMSASVALEQTTSARIIRTIAFPLECISVLIGSGRSMPFHTALTIVLAQCIGWTLLGLVGLRYTAYALARGR